MSMSPGFKALIVAGLALVLLIPLMLIDGIVAERDWYQTGVEADIANAWTGPQSLIGPVMVVAYRVRSEQMQWNPASREHEPMQRHDWFTAYLLPGETAVDVKVDTEIRARGIYSVPVYTSRIRIDGTFAGETLAALKAQTSGFAGWGKAYVGVVIGDTRGVGATPGLDWNGSMLTLEPGSRVNGLATGLSAELPAVSTDQDMPFALDLRLRGSHSLRLAPLARNAVTTMTTDWPHPKFAGRFLPDTHAVRDDGFDAQWHTSAFSTNARQLLDACLGGSCDALAATTQDVEFIETVDIYQQTRRATKYGLLFIVMSFVALFMTETLLRRQLHPVQYLLLGLALAIFFLLLISLSEHLGFGLAYGIATGAVAALVSVYASGVLDDAKLGVAFGAGVVALYSVLFAILKSEDMALLAGSLLVFAVLAAVMLLTRRTDWYRLSARSAQGST